LLVLLVGCLRTSSSPSAPALTTDSPATLATTPVVKSSGEPPNPTQTPAASPLLSTLAATETMAAPTMGAPSPTSEGAVPPYTGLVLKDFPLGLANSWVYDYQAYDLDRKSTWQVADTVIDVQTHPPFVAAHIQRGVTLLDGPADLRSIAPDSYWYILEGGLVYRIVGELDWSQVRNGSLEFVFPLPGERCWFPAVQQRSQPFNQDLPGCRRASGPVNLQFPVGAFERCYQLATPFNNGSIKQTFCSGIGLVQEKFDHAGTPFGYQMTLIAYAFQ
jgi:hypothetical protein